ncbi:MAG TPA: CHAT domain-containing tetratricopeptide repeat protein [Acidobacteriota bacterium]|nr:CHAT domain-containing tetratricopeptide repeat protein [Acidobacteriota bacterium]
MLIFARALCFGGQARSVGQDRGPLSNQRGPFDPESSLRIGGQSIPTLEAQAREAEKTGKWTEAALAYLRITVLARQKGELQKALGAGANALRLSAREKLSAIEVMTDLNLSRVYRLTNQENKSRALLENGLVTVKGVKDPARQQLLEANLYREFGFHFLKTGDTNKAIDYISRALQADQSLLASFEAAKGRRATGATRRALASTQKNIVLTLLRLGTAQRGAGNPDEAFKAYETGLELIKKFGRKFAVEGSYYQELGELYLERKDYPRAIEYLNHVLLDRNVAQTEPATVKASGQMGFALLETGKPLDAIAQFKRAIGAVESIRARLESEELRTTFFDNKRRVYVGMILAQVAAGHVEEGFDYNERARSRAFLDILGNKVELARERDLIAEEKALQARLRDLQAKSSYADDSDDDESADEAGDDEELSKEIAEAQKAYDAFLGKVRKENKEQASLMSVEPLNLKQVQQMLDPGVTLLEYFVSGEQVLLWTVDKERTDFVAIPVRRGELMAKVRALRQRISEPTRPSAAVKESAQELYRLLIEPARPSIHGKELLIVPHDVLHYVPFQALVGPAGRYLIEDYPIEYLSSASLMQFTKGKKKNSRVSALALGNPDLGDAAFNLRFAEREAKEVAQAYPKSSILVRGQATKVKAVSLSPDNDVLHFAVHAEFNQEDPMSSALLLAKGRDGDGKLKAGEIFGLNLKADLVVLSACETGLGKISNGDEIVGLTRAFIYAGTPSVITTLWKVNDRSSYELMHEFYANLRTARKSEALRQAQLKIMKEFPQPFFWAAFGLTGEP